MFIDHVTLRTRDLRGTRDFMMQVFDLEEGRRPIEKSTTLGHWLYSNGEPLVHIIEARGQGLLRAAELIDHVGFRMKDYDVFKAKLEHLGIAYRTTEIPTLNERRIFFTHPRLAVAGNRFPWPLVETELKDDFLNATGGTPVTTTSKIPFR